MILTDDVFHAEAQVELCLEILVFLDDLALAERPLNGQFEFFVDERLGQKVESAHADRLHGHVDRAVTGDQDNRRLGSIFPAIGQHVEAVAIVFKPHVGQHQIERAFFQLLDGLCERAGHLDLVVQTAKPLAHRLADVAIIVDEQ